MDIQTLTEKQKDQLLSVSPSKDSVMEFRPCQVTLKNGDILDNVYIAEVNSYLKDWGMLPNDDSGKMSILIEEVESITSSPNRLKPELANKLYKAGESGMGYCIFKIIFDNKQTLDVLSGNAVDFVPTPTGLTTKNIKDVLPHEGSRTNYVNGLEYYWCLFQGSLYGK